MRTMADYLAVFNYLDTKSFVNATETFLGGLGRYEIWNKKPLVTPLSTKLGTLKSTRNDF